MFKLTGMLFLSKINLFRQSKITVTLPIVLNYLKPARAHVFVFVKCVLLDGDSKSIFPINVDPCSIEEQKGFFIDKLTGEMDTWEGVNN